MNDPGGQGNASFLCPIVIAGLMIVIVFSWLGTQSATGLLNTGDEFFTAERSREMLLCGPWAVRNNFEVIGLKPPLQYWLTTLTLPRMQNRELAVRIWPLIYGALTAIAVGWLMYVVDPTRPWLIPLSIGLLLTCPIFLRETYRALLDSGLTFFTTVAIACAQLARNRPKWWLGVALTCWLGALQKIPLILLLWLIIIAIRLFRPEGQNILRSGWLWIAMIATAFALAAWPLIEMFQFRLTLADFFRFAEVLDLAKRRASRIYLEIPLRLMTAWPGGIFALAAAASLPFGAIKKSRSAIIEVSVISGALLALSIAANLRNVRYVLPIIPCLCVLLALFVYGMMERRKPFHTVAVVIAALLSVAGLGVGRWIIKHDHVDLAQEATMARELGAQPSSDSRLILMEGNNGLQREEFYLFYGDLKFPLANFSVAQIRQNPPRPPLLGICLARDLPVLRDQFPNLKIAAQTGELIRWQVER